MGVALTGSNPKRVTFPVATRADLVNGIQAALLATGWTLDSTVTGGYVLKGTSPQSLWVKLKVWDNGLSSGGVQQASLQFSSPSGTGLERPLAVASGYTYSVWSNCCSAFISRPSIRWDIRGSVVAGGVPYLFSGDLGTVSEVWYSFADAYGSAVSYGSTPRIRLLQFKNLTHNTPDAGSFTDGGYFNEAQWGTHYCESYQAHYDSTGNQVWAGVPEILTLQESDDCERLTYDNQTLLDKALITTGIVAEIDSDVAIRYDPLLAWGTTITDRAAIRGQVYDSIVTSHPRYGDAGDVAEPVITLPYTSTYHWRNFTDQYYWGALWLLEPVIGGARPGNVAF